MEPKVRPVGRPPDLAEDAAAIGEAESGLALDEEAADLVGEPRGVPEFHGDLEIVRESIERACQPVDIAPQLGRELEEDGSDLPAETTDTADEPVHRLFRIVELPDVRQIPAHLDRHPEVVGR